MALGAQQLGVLGGISSSKLSEILGSTIPFLGGIKVKSGMVGGRPTVGVGKEVVKNVSVFVGRNLNEERGVYEQQASGQMGYGAFIITRAGRQGAAHGATAAAGGRFPRAFGDRQAYLYGGGTCSPKRGCWPSMACGNCARRKAAAQRPGSFMSGEFNVRAR